MALLSLKNVHTYYGRVQALKGISLEVNKGEIVALIGANGAGKSTTLMTICGRPGPRKGEIFFDNESLSGLPTDQIVKKGIFQVPEGRHIFPQMTVLENLNLGAYLRNDKNKIETDLEKVHTLFPILADREKQIAGTLSGGEQQMLAMGRALMGHPRLLLLDEPSMGLAPIIVRQIFDIIKEINKQGTTVFLVEQNAYLALNLAHRAYIMETGSITMTGTGQEFLADDRVREAYLGEIK
jgi:branched-chain amino acid transport system ATP-binding protein